MNLANLKAGDRVIVNDRAGFGDDVVAEIATVKRTTATRIVVSLPNLAGTPHDRAFRKDTGREVGDAESFRPVTIEVATPERIAQVEEATKRRKLLDRIAATGFRRLPTAKLERIAGVLDGKDPAEALLRRVLAAMKDPDADGYFDGEQIEADIETYLGEPQS